MIRHKSPQPFEQGEMVFSPSQIELCGVKVCCGDESGMIRKILDKLRKTNPHGQFIRLSGAELAKLVGCVRGQNGVAEAIAGFRSHVCQVMLDEANIQVDRLHDIILNDRVNGYRLSPKIVVSDVEKSQVQTDKRQGDASNNGISTDDMALNQRQQWAMKRLAMHGKLCKADLVAQFKCSTATAERDLRSLRQRKLIEFIGSARMGIWRSPK